MKTRLLEAGFFLNIGVPARRINEIVLGKRGITADTALRLARFFGMSAQFWTGLQSQYDLDVAEEEIRRLSFAREQVLLVLFFPLFVHFKSCA